MPETDHEHWMARAIELAKLAEQAGEVPVGAVLIEGETLLGEGFNRPVTSDDPTAHAEITALRNAARRKGNYRLPGTTLYVTIEPCTMCVGALMHARVGRLVFGAREPRAGAVFSNAQLTGQAFFNHRIAVEEGVMADSCGDLIRAFFLARRGT